jgi:urease beta subunit
MRALLLLAAACGPPEVPRQGVTFRDGDRDGPDSGERGTVKISEVGWAGSVTDDGTWDPADVFVEIRNEGNRPLDVGGWQLVVEGAVTRTSVLPPNDREIAVGEHWFYAAKSTGCFPEPDGVVSDLHFEPGEPFEVTLLDADDRLIEPVGDTDSPPFAGGYDLVESRSMERVELMFGGEGTSPTMWHFYTDGVVVVPNNDRIAETCRVRTLASPGRPNSPDYSGATASGSLE